MCVVRVAGTVIQGGSDSAKVLAADIRAGKVSGLAAVHLCTSNVRRAY